MVARPARYVDPGRSVVADLRRLSHKSDEG